jgi:hypothetical protein
MRPISPEYCRDMFAYGFDAILQPYDASNVWFDPAGYC